MNSKIYYIYLCVLINVGALGRNVRLIGGTSTSISDFPHMVSFRIHSNNLHFCAGSIVSHWHVLSAAHCFKRFENDFWDIRVYSGTTSSTDISGPSYGIDLIVTHIHFTGVLSLQTITAHDIAIVTLDKYIEFNSHQKKIKLPSRDIFAGNVGVMVGWGITSFPSGSLSEYLRKAPVSILDKEACAPAVPVEIKDTHFCGYNGAGVGTCAGDSGGSVVSNGELFGIISFSFQCATGIPDIHTKVYDYLEFITFHIGDN